MVLFSIYWRTDMFLELIVIIASLGFLTTVAFYYFLSRQGPEAALGQDEKLGGDA
jgi:multisubunit Na+/H+ antiporter MnhF subunit